MSRLHRSLCEAVVNTTDKIMFENIPADKAIERILKSNPKWGSHDRRWIAEHVYEIVRWYRRLAEPLCREKTPSWLVLAAQLTLEGNCLPNWSEWRDFDKVSWHKWSEKLLGHRAYRLAVTDWLDALGSAELGNEKWELEMEASNKPAHLVLRVNTLKTTTQKVIDTLKSDGISASPIQKYPNAVILDKRVHIFNHELYKNGHIELQDAGSQAISMFTDPKPGMLVMDLCAGAGGKTLHLAALMRNKGKIIAYDSELWKLEELKRRSKRAGVFNIECIDIANSQKTSAYISKADIVLVDVPCSGTGVFKRNPDSKWKLNQEKLDHLRQTQQYILNEYSRFTKPNGILVYATCSMLASENQLQIEYFLSKKPQFRLLEELQIFPSEGFDGFFMAKMKFVP